MPGTPMPLSVLSRSGDATAIADAQAHQVLNLVDGQIHAGNGMRGVLGNVRERLLDDAIYSQTDSRRHLTWIPIDVDRYVHPGRGVLFNQASHVRGRGKWSQDRWSAGGRCLGSLEQPNRSAYIRQALAAQAFGLGEGLLGALGVPLQDVARAGEMQHGYRKRVRDHIMDLVRDALA